MFRDIATLMNSPVRIKALAYLLKRPGEEGSATELASLSGMTRESAHKELTALVRLGVARTRGTLREKKFVANEHHILYEPVRALLVHATTPHDKDIIDAFKGIRGLWLIVAGGVLTDEPRSSADLLIITRNPEEPGIQKAIKKIEMRSAVPLRYAVMEVEEYMGRRQAYDRLLRDMFEYTHRIVLERGG